MRLFLASLLPKFRRRVPSAIRGHRGWDRCGDRLVAGHFLAGARRRELVRRLQACRTPGDYYDFASGIFPAHQVRTEIVGFLERAREERPRTVMEIGTAQGGTNFLLGVVLPEVTLKIGVDLFVQNTRLLDAFARPGCRQVFLNGSSYGRGMAQRVRAALDERVIDVLFIDGDHAYAGVKADFETYAPLVRPGGLIAFHDIVPDHLTRFGRATGRYAGDVPRFWQDVRGGFAETWEFVESWDQDGLGIGVGRVKSAQTGGA